MENHIENIKFEIAKINVTDQAIAQLRNDFLPLTIADINDKIGYERVKEALSIVREKRLAVEEKRKELKADSLEYGRAVDAEAARVQKGIAEIEGHLKGEKDRIDVAKEEIKNAKKRAEQEKIKRRTDELIKYGALFNGVTWQIGRVGVSQTEIVDAVEDMWRSVMQTVQLESENVAKQKAEEEAEKKRMDEERAEFAKKQADIAAREAAVKQAEEQNQREAIAEKARLDGIEEGKRLAAAKVEAERLRGEKEKADAEAEAKRVAELAPDKEKLLAYFSNFPATPKLKNKAAKAILDTFIEYLTALTKKATELK